MLTKTAKQECNRRFDFTHYAGRIQEKDMFRLLKPLTLGLSVIGSVGVYSLTVAPSASAFSFFNGDTAVGISESDRGKVFTVNFDGNVNEKDVSGLSSEALFKFEGFKTVGTKTEALFDVKLTNTSSNGITSRSSALGFNVLNFDGTSLGSTLSLVGVGNTNRDGNTRVTGLFSNDRSGDFPNKFGDIDVCFTDGNTCQGGGSGGVTTGNTGGNFKATLAFSGEVESFALNNFGVRYQSINGQTFAGASGTGRGTIDIGIPSERPRQVPEPTATTALFLIGAGALKYGKKKPQPLIQTEG